MQEICTLGSAWGDGFKKPRSLGEGTGAKASDNSEAPQRATASRLVSTIHWSAIRQAAKYLPHCSDIVVLARLKWITNTKHAGKDSHAWFRFDRQHSSGPVLKDRGEAQRRSRVLRGEQIGALKPGK